MDRNNIGQVFPTFSAIRELQMEFKKVSESLNSLRAEKVSVEENLSGANRKNKDLNERLLRISKERREDNQKIAKLERKLHLTNDKANKLKTKVTKMKQAHDDLNKKVQFDNQLGEKEKESLQFYKEQYQHLQQMYKPDTLKQREIQQISSDLEAQIQNRDNIQHVFSRAGADRELFFDSIKFEHWPDGICVALKLLKELFSHRIFQSHERTKSAVFHNTSNVVVYDESPPHMMSFGSPLSGNQSNETMDSSRGLLSDLSMQNRRLENLLCKSLNFKDTGISLKELSRQSPEEDPSDTARARPRYTPLSTISNRF